MLEFEFTAELDGHFPAQIPQQLLGTLEAVFPIKYKMVNKSPRNSCQLDSTFDQELRQKLDNQLIRSVELPLPDGFSAEYAFDAAFELPEVGKVVVEVEKADHQKILYDILKAHIYLRAGAQSVVLLIPTTRGRKAKQNQMFEIGRTPKRLHTGWHDENRCWLS